MDPPVEQDAGDVGVHTQPSDSSPKTPQLLFLHRVCNTVEDDVSDSPAMARCTARDLRFHAQPCVLHVRYFQEHFASDGTLSADEGEQLLR